jgi:MerR family redox-sensitive transcriptional activator SoxR
MAGMTKTTTKKESEVALLPIGVLAARAGVPTSTVRYYERIGLLAPDDRQSGQRRYTDSSLRRLVFIGMLQDAGLSLDEIAAVLGAATVDDWKDIARRRLELLDRQLAELSRSRELLEGALLCRFDHPLDECRVMGSEIDRRLTSRPPQPTG